MLFVKQWRDVFATRPLEFTIGLCLFSCVAMGGAVKHASSTSLAVLILISWFYVRHWPRLWRQTSSSERLVFLGFSLYFFSAVLAYWNVEDVREYVKVLDRYFRFFLIIPVYLLVSDAISSGNLKVFPFLLLGALVSAPVYLGFALLSLSDNPAMPAKAYYHHITFGGMAMLNVVFLSTMLLMKKTDGISRFVLLAAISCLIVATVLSQARSAWLSLLVCLLLLVFLAVLRHRIRTRTVIIAVLVLVSMVLLSPAKDIIGSRVQQAVEEVALFKNADKHDTSIGMRFAMWHIAIDTWKKHPVIGSGPGDFDTEMRQAQQQGRYTQSEIFESTHNIFLQALADTGMIGFLVLIAALFVLPFRLFYRAYSEGEHVIAVIGMAVLTAFAVFGLTESWIWRAPVVSVYLIYFVALAAMVSAKEAVNR